MRIFPGMFQDIGKILFWMILIDWAVKGMPISPYHFLSSEHNNNNNITDITDMIDTFISEKKKRSLINPNFLLFAVIQACFI